MTQFFNESRSDVLASEDQSCTRRQLFMNWVPSFYHFFFMFRKEIDDFVSFIQVSLNTISRHFLVWHFKKFRFFHNLKWNQKFMHWFMREYFILRCSTDKSQVDSTHAFLFSPLLIIHVFIGSKIGSRQHFFLNFPCKCVWRNVCQMNFIFIWKLFSLFYRQMFLIHFQRTLKFNS